MAVTIFALAVTAIVRANNVDVIQVVECGQSRICDKRYVAAPTAISPGRSPKRHELLAPKGDATIASVSANHLNLAFVDKAHTSPTYSVLQRPWPRSGEPAKHSVRTSDVVCDSSARGNRGLERLSRLSDGDSRLTLAVPVQRF